MRVFDPFDQEEKSRHRSNEIADEFQNIVNTRVDDAYVIICLSAKVAIKHVRYRLGMKEKKCDVNEGSGFTSKIAHKLGVNAVNDFNTCLRWFTFYAATKL